MAEAKTNDTKELKGKIKNMANIIEELSSSSGDAEEMVDSKLGEINDKFGTQVDEIKKSLADLDKKAGKPVKVKEELGLDVIGSSKIMPMVRSLEELQGTFLHVFFHLSIYWKRFLVAMDLNHARA